MVNQLKTLAQRAYRVTHTNWLGGLPPWLSRWAGYRATPPPAPPQYIVWIWSWIGAFGGMAVLQAVFGYADYFTERAVPPPSIVASFGASAVLCYGALESPLGQPRALLGGHFLGSLIGVSITKLFLRMGTDDYLDAYQWLAGSLSCATAIVAMQMTKTVHPPAGISRIFAFIEKTDFLHSWVTGATALLAAVSAEVRNLGWYYMGVVMLSATLVWGVALLNNNMQRRWPVYWVAPGPPPGPILPVTAEPKRVESSNASTAATPTNTSATTIEGTGRRPV
ncbi:hypothetical protein PQX77_017364 [Marasmius sp. AFHP31]|nr:hypothetical protein PQX77_017364 [Marasmius sp. AFHP31]